MKQKSIKNLIRNISLVVLTVLMVVLTLLSGFSAVGGDIWEHYRSLTHANLGYEVRSGDSPAAYPSSIAMTGTDGVLYGAAYNERSTAQLYEVTRELMGSALGAAESFEALTEDGLRELLAGETLCYGYNGEIPLRALAVWLEGSCSSDLNISMLLLTADGNLALRTRELGLVVSQTTVDQNAWQRTASALGVGACSYAGMSSAPASERLAAETLIFDGIPASAELLVSEPPAFGDPNAADSLQTLLSAFDYSVYARSYEERDGQVYVDNDSTIRVYEDGTVRYTAARRELETEAAVLPLTDAIEQARVILARAQYSIGAGTQAELLSASKNEEGGTTLLFGLVFEGVPIQASEPYARFDFADGQLIRAVIRLRRFSSDGSRQYILPVQQAAAATRRANQRVGIAYIEGDAGHYAAERCFIFG